jgi:DNA-binding CsgD family transcriptional regulator
MQTGLIDEPLVTALYDTALYGGDWQPALERFRALLNSADAALTLWQTGAPEPQVNTPGHVLTPELRQSYFAYYGRIDPKLRILYRRTPNFLFNDADHFDADFVARDPFYQEYSRPLGTRHTLDMTIERNDGCEIFLATMRSSAQGPYEARAESFFRQAATHFARVLTLKEKIQRAQIFGCSASAALDRLRLGVIVLDGSGQVAIANRAAERATAAGEPLQLRQGRLSARSARVAAGVEAMIRAALQPNGTAGALRVPRSDGSAWSVWAAPLPADTPISVRGEYGALVLIGRAEGDSALRREELVALYDLTSAEFELARALCGGSTLTEAADARGVKISTARSQLLSILQKTGARGQADLIRMLALLPSASLEPN